MSPESNIIRSYLEWVSSLPYGIASLEKYDISNAKLILDEEHYGMNDIKNRIL